MFGGANALVQLRFQALVQVLGFTGLLLAHGGGNALGTTPGVRKLLFVSRLRRVRLLFQPFRRGEIVADDFAAI